MHIISWNVNGLRSLEKNGDWEDFVKLDPDIFLLQETKAEPDQLSDALRSPASYHSYFSYSKGRKGYSGVALYAKKEPNTVEHGMEVPEFDDEGRIVAGYFDDFVLFGVYFPNGGQGNKRVPYKMDFYDVFLEHIEKLRKEGHSIIVGGDVNTAHEEIDLARPKDNEDNTGFLPEEREWLDELERTGYVDTFRHFYPDKEGAYSYWDLKTRARDRNVGWRLDYFFISPDLLPKLKNAYIRTDIYGSDHAPVGIELAL